jgi:CDP-diacylglycerol---glycerol-3-phosphate 3-phosphatidyltransferase
MKKTTKSKVIISNLANKITLARIILIPVFIVILLSNMKYHAIIAATVFAIISLSDFLDGYVARSRNEITAAGAMLDPLADKLLISAALVFLIGNGVVAWMAYVIIAREFLITGLRMLANIKNTNIPVKMSGKIKTTVQMLAVGAVILSLPYANWAMLIATILTIYSGLEYMWMGRSLLKDVF